MVGDDFLCCAVEISRAAVVAEAGPEFEHFILWCTGEGFDARKSAEESLVVRSDGGDARLLQHNLRYPDAIGIAARAPGEIALVLAEPGEEAALEDFQHSGSELRFHVRRILA